MTKKKNLAFLAKVENIARLVVYVNMAIFWNCIMEIQTKLKKKKKKNKMEWLKMKDHCNQLKNNMRHVSFATEILVKKILRKDIYDATKKSAKIGIILAVLVETA